MMLIGFSAFAQTSLRTRHTFGLIVVLFVNRYVFISICLFLAENNKPIAFGKNVIYVYAGNADHVPPCAYAQGGPGSAFARRYFPHSHNEFEPVKGSQFMWP